MRQRSYCDLIPFILFNRYDYNTNAFLLVLFHDFLDHLDGIVAKVQKVIYGQIDDPILGGFMDAFCDKVAGLSNKYLLCRDCDSNDNMTFIDGFPKGYLHVIRAFPSRHLTSV